MAKKKYELVNPKGEIVEIVRLKQFCETNFMNYKSLLRVISGKRSMFRGWRLPTLETIGKTAYGRKNHPFCVIGVYVIECLSTGKKYIGSSKKIQDRFTSHKRVLTRGKHHNPYFQNAWNKYGEEDFDFRILEKCELDVLREKEAHWIKHYNTTNPDLGYNLTSDTVCTILGSKRKSTQGFQPIPIDLVDPNGDIVHITNLQKFCEERNLNPSCLGKINRGKQKQAYGFRSVAPENIGVKFEDMERLVKRKYTFVFTSPDGEKFEVVSIPKFCQKHGLSVSAMNHLGYKDCNTYKGWTADRIAV